MMSIHVNISASMFIVEILNENFGVYEPIGWFAESERAIECAKGCARSGNRVHILKREVKDTVFKDFPNKKKERTKHV